MKRLLVLWILAAGCGGGSAPETQLPPPPQPSTAELPPDLAAPRPEPAPEPEVVEQREQVVDFKYDMAGLEWFITDQETHKGRCPDMPWEQPSIDVYRQEPKSYLPEGCGEGDAGEEEESESKGQEPLMELPARRRKG